MGESPKPIILIFGAFEYFLRALMAFPLSELIDNKQLQSVGAAFGIDRIVELFN